MRSQIVQSKIGFSFNDHTGRTPVYQNITKQTLRQFSSGPLKVGKIEGESLASQTADGAIVRAFWAWQRGEH
jgi:hypothetical protein